MDGRRRRDYLLNEGLVVSNGIAIFAGRGGVLMKSCYNLYFRRGVFVAHLHVEHVRDVETPCRMLVAELRALSEDLLHLRVILSGAALHCMRECFGCNTCPSIFLP